MDESMNPIAAAKKAQAELLYEQYLHTRTTYPESAELLKMMAFDAAKEATWHCEHPTNNINHSTIRHFRAEHGTITMR